MVHPLAQAPGLTPRGKSRSCAELASSPGSVLLQPSTSRCPGTQVREWRRDTAQVQGEEPFPKMAKPTGPRSVSPDNGGVQVLKGRDVTLKLLIPS